MSANFAQAQRLMQLNMVCMYEMLILLFPSIACLIKDVFQQSKVLHHICFLIIIHDMIIHRFCCKQIDKQKKYCAC